MDLDHSLLTDNRIEQRESSLIENNLFINARTNSIPEDMATHQPSTSHENGEIANNTPVANVEIEAKIGRLRDTIGERAYEASIQTRQEEILDRIEAITGLQDRMSWMEIALRLRKRLTNIPNNTPHDKTLNVTYGRTQEDVREARNRLVREARNRSGRLKDARSLISEIDRHSRQKMQEFISASMRWRRSISRKNQPY